MPKTPDASPQTVASKAADAIRVLCLAVEGSGRNVSPEFRALADALDQQAAAPTWDVMCDRLAEKLGEMLTSADGYGSIPRRARVIAPSILRHVLPELAPSDD